MSGRGVYTSANGDRYEGEWRDGKQSGQGLATSASGNRYDGQLRDGMRHGKGVLTLANGVRYDGEWRDDKFVEASRVAQANRTEIKLREKAGTFLVPVRVNDALTLNFTIDSGAADVSIQQMSCLRS